MRKISNAELDRPNIETYAAMPKLPVIVILDNIRSLNNVGSFFRTCDAFAIERLILCGITGTPPSRELHKTALGAENTVAWEYNQNTVDTITKLNAAGYTSFAIEQVENAVMLDAFTIDSTKKYVLVFGNEVDGVNQQVVDLCHHALEIPQLGTKHSLNVSVAGGAVLWHVFNSFLSLNK